MPIEAEIKLELPPERLAGVAKSPLIRKRQAAPPRSADLVSVYYDTRKRKLCKRGITLRLRRHGRRQLQTVKADGDRILTQQEWEHEVDGKQPDFKAARGTALEPLLGKKLRRQLAPLFETKIKRTIVLLRWRDSDIELALDRGQLRAGRKRAPISEVEIELKDGEEADLIEVARAVAGVAPVRLGALSKAERGYRLVEGEQGEAVTRAPIHLPDGIGTGDAFRAVALACLRQIAGNEPAVLGGDAEGVHQMRIGLRRLRTALAVFSDLLDGDPQAAKVKHALKWITGELGPARDLDVYLRGSLKPLNGAHRRSVRALSRATARRRKSAFERAGKAVASPRYRRLILDVFDRLNTGAWAESDDKMLRLLNERPAADFAADELTRRRRKLVKKADKFAKLGPQQRHKLRVNAKKLRYATEFFAALIAGGKADRRRRAFVKALKRVQDALGELNDIAVHGKLGPALAQPRSPPRSGKRLRGRAMAAGLVAGQVQSKVAPLMQAAETALQDFAAVSAFWR